ncbi:hypothetical protein EJ04DRAFT_556790 [Polyplosphaeria fusca]|uniref:Uncharacterized protein n=1 Tax=Polyplosphaeria fusca TaxID=682080 RepID=A0A9P4QKY4_9PLEO|nr:hypothetical protein EJ04DRAFT_556790 [Polyplosphaeria fusca]
MARLRSEHSPGEANELGGFSGSLTTGMVPGSAGGPDSLAQLTTDSIKPGMPTEPVIQEEPKETGTAPKRGRGLPLQSELEGRPQGEATDGNVTEEPLRKRLRSSPSEASQKNTAEEAQKDSTEVNNGRVLRRGRGRPAKGIDAKAENNMHESSLEAETAAQKDASGGEMKRGRGRPKKNADQPIKLDKDQQNLKDPAPKRGRGRPAKNTGDVVEAQENAEVPSLKRGRGRPRKTNMSTAEQLQKAAPTAGNNGTGQTEAGGVNGSNDQANEVGQSPKTRPSISTYVLFAIPASFSAEVEDALDKWTEEQSQKFGSIPAEGIDGLKSFLAGVSRT